MDEGSAFVIDLNDVTQLEICYDISIPHPNLHCKSKHIHTWQERDTPAKTFKLPHHCLLHPTFVSYRDRLISLGCENEWEAKRLREGCLKDIDGSNPFTPPPSWSQDPERGQNLQHSSQSAHIGEVNLCTHSKNMADYFVTHFVTCENRRHLGYWPHHLLTKNVHILL